MNDNELLNILVEQEEKLVFTNLSIDRLKNIGKDIVRKLEEMKRCAYILISVNGQTIYSEAMKGTSPDNQGWARRKGNVVNLLWKSSYRVDVQMRVAKRSFEERGLSKSDYAVTGGAFPIKISRDIVIGYIAVSGMASEEDHQIITDVLSSELGIPIHSVL